jgi:hypothetical protein
MPRSVKDFTVTAHRVAGGGGYCAPSCAGRLTIAPTGQVKDAVGYIMFPTDWIPDFVYGSLWQAAFVQHRGDLLWQQPHKPCDVENTWAEDDGSCLEDTLETSYYAHRPVEEARDSVPENAPEMPDGTTMHVLDLDELDQETPPDGAVFPPPVAVGIDDATALPNRPETPWGLFLRQTDCVDDAGRFAGEYESNGIEPTA